MKLAAILSTGTSVVSIIVTVSVLALLFLRKLKQKTEQDGKISLLWTVPFVILTLISISLIGAAIGTNKEIGKEGNMDDIVSESNLIITNARQRLGAVRISRYDEYISLYDIIRDLRLKIDADLKVGLIKDVSLGYKVKVQMDDTVSTDFKSWAEQLQLNPCSQKQMVAEHKMMTPDTYAYLRALSDFFRYHADPIWSFTNNYFLKLTKELKTTIKTNYGKWKVENGLNVRKKMLDNLELDINNAPTTRRKLVEEQIEKLPNRQKIFKTAVIGLCSISILLSTMSIIIIVFGHKFLHHDKFLKGTSLLICITGFCSLVTSVAVIVLSLDVIEKCSLNEQNFGVKDFLTTSPGNEPSSVCLARDSSFYGGLGNDTMILFEDLERVFEIKKRKEVHHSEIYVQLHKLVLTEEYNKTLDDLNTRFEKLDLMCKNKCFPNYVKKTCDYRDLVAGIVDGSVVMQPMVDQFNEFFEHRNQTIDNLFDWYYTRIYALLKDHSIDPTQNEVVAADFSCNLLIDKFSKTGRSICHQVDIPVDIFHIYLTVVVVSFICQLILNALMLKYSNFERNNGIAGSLNLPILSFEYFNNLRTFLCYPIY